MDRRIGLVIAADSVATHGALRGSPRKSPSPRDQRCLHAESRFIAYELVLHHAAALALVDRAVAEQLAGRLGSWGEVDAFGTLLAGPASAHGKLADADVHDWAVAAIPSGHSPSALH